MTEREFEEFLKTLKNSTEIRILYEIMKRGMRCISFFLRKMRRIDIPMHLIGEKRFETYLCTKKGSRVAA